MIEDINQPPKSEFTPQRRDIGWAPGGYSCKCGDCGRQHYADKRAWRCLPCADIAIMRKKQAKENGNGA